MRFMTFLVAILAAQYAAAEEPDLAGYFGFESLEVVKINRGAGPIACADMNNDGLNDLIAVNNFASRIEVHYQKRDASPNDEVKPPSRVNEFPEHWRFNREYVSVSHEVAAVLAHDFDHDGMMDLIYAGMPSDLVFVRQTSPGNFDISRRHIVQNLGATRNAFAIANVIGDSNPEILSLVEGEITIWPLTNDRIGQPTILTTGEPMIAFMVEDYNGDNLNDIIGVIPEDSAPVRIWLGISEDGIGKFGSQLRFEMPPLRELVAVRLPGESAARIAVIERISNRVVVGQLDADTLEESGNREAAYTVHSFTDAGNRQRDTAVVDVDGDGLLDLLSTDTEANTLVWYRQLKGKGVQSGVSYPCLAELDYVVAENVDDDPYAEIFVLSEEEGVVGRCDASQEEIPFPTPLNIPDGQTPVALQLVNLEGGSRVVIVAKAKREYDLHIIDMEGNRETISLGSHSRPPDTILGLDADQDGMTDLLLFTPDKPMIMALATADGFNILESTEMGQFGLVKAASSHNTAAMDIDGDDRSEFLVAEKNFVRALRYDTKPEPGVSPGWQVVRQINASDSSSELVSIAQLGNRIIASDKENSRLVVMGRGRQVGTAGEPASPTQWSELESLQVRGFKLGEIYAGNFSGDDEANILAISNDGFALVRLGGERLTLQEIDAWRTTEERQIHHELTAGDVNSDGFTDLICLDAGEQMCEIFTFSKTGKMIYAAGFKVYESKMFGRGETREYQPIMSLIADITGDGANDLILLAHDRVLIYPQMTE